MSTGAHLEETSGRKEFGRHASNHSHSCFGCGEKFAYDELRVVEWGSLQVLKCGKCLGDGE